jgi:hypothetical protein
VTSRLWQRTTNRRTGEQGHTANLHCSQAKRPNHASLLSLATLHFTCLYMLEFTSQCAAKLACAMVKWLAPDVLCYGVVSQKMQVKIQSLHQHLYCTVTNHTAICSPRHPRAAGPHPVSYAHVFLPAPSPSHMVADVLWSSHCLLPCGQHQRQAGATNTDTTSATT